MISGRKKVISFIAAAIVIIIISSAVIVILTPKQATNPSIYSEIGLHDGDYFIYSILGTYNGSSINGTYKTERIGHGAWSIGPFKTSSPELDQKMYNSGISFASSYQLGTCKFPTPFGTKNVVWAFGFCPGPMGIDLATVSFYGIDPNVVYGYRINGPDLHLDLVLNQTNNADVKINNTNAFAWTDPNDIEFSIGGGNVELGISEGWYIVTDGARMNFTITGGSIRLYGFSEGNMLSMMEGGPFAYNSGFSRVNATNEVVETLIPQGIFVISICGLSNETGRFEYTLVQV